MDARLDTEINASALEEKCLNTASCANTIPAIGELNPAEIAAATPQPIRISLPRFKPLSQLDKKHPNEPPMCTIGPY